MVEDEQARCSLRIVLLLSGSFDSVRIPSTTVVATAAKEGRVEMRILVLKALS